MLHDFVETSTLGEDELRSWNRSFHLLLVAVCPAVGPEEVIAVKHGDGIHGCSWHFECAPWLTRRLCSQWAPELSQWQHGVDCMD